MGRKYNQDEINDILGDLGNVTQKNYTAPTVKSNVAPAMAVVAQQPRTVQPTVTMNTQPIPQTSSTVEQTEQQAKKEDKKKAGILKTALKTAGNIATNMGEGALRTGESVLDTLNDIADAINNPLTYVGNKAAYGKDVAKKALKESEKKQTEFIKRDLVNEMNEATGWNDMKEDWERDSLVKSGNFGGQLAQGVGAMVPSLLAGRYLGFDPKLSSIKGLSGAQKAKAIAGNVAKTYVSQLPSNAVLGLSSYGSGVEEALNDGASRNQSRLMGLANVGIEQGTEMLTGGVPGLGGKGGIDQFIEPFLDKIPKGYADDFIRYMYRATGEGLEEKVGTYLDALAKKGILGKDIDWKEVWKDANRAFALGTATGAVLDSGQLVGDLGKTRTEKQQEKLNTPQEAQKQAIEPQTEETRPITQETQNVSQTAQEQPNKIEQKYVDNTKQLEYNKGTNETESVNNDFRTIQEESRRKLDDENWGDSSKAVDEDLRGRIRGTLSEEIKRRGYSDSNNDGVLKLESKGNNFNLYKNVDAETFHDMFEIARTYTDNGELVDLHPINTNEDSLGYNEMNNYLSDDGMQGFSITKDGDVVSVFNADPSRKGFLRSIVGEINNNGKTLDCFNSSKQRLDEIYSKVFGWKTASVMDHNMDYDHDNIAKNHNNPPVSFMVNPNQLKSDVTDADLNKKFGKDQYDEAVAYRSSLMKDGEGNKNDFVFGKDGYFKGMREGTSDSSFSNETKNEIVKSNGEVVTAPIETKGDNKLANIEINVNDGGNGGNNNNNNRGLATRDSGDMDDARILENYKDRKANKKASFKERTDDFLHSVVRGLFDRGEIINRIGKNHNDKELYHLYDWTFTADGSANFNIGDEKDGYQTNLSGEKVGESLDNCWKPVEDAGLVRQMNAYLYELHNIDRWNQFNEDGTRKYVFSENHSDEVSKQNIKELLRMFPQLEDMAKPILQYQKNLLNIAVESGQVSQKMADKLNEMYKNYVPTWRDKDKQSYSTLKRGLNNISVDSPLKQATGSKEDLLPLKEVQAQMTKNMFKSAKMNLFGQQLYKDIGDLNQLKEIGMNELKGMTEDEQVLKDGEAYLDDYLKKLAPNNIPVDTVKGEKTMTVYFDGKKVSMPINDEIETAIKPAKPNNRVARFTSKINDFKRGVITQYNPGFSVSNALKDAPDAMLNSKYGKEFPAEYAKTVKEMLGKGLAGKDLELFNQYCALGAYSNSIFDTTEGFKKDSKLNKTVGFIPNAISDINDIIEQIPRFTEFKLSLKHGATLSEAMYNAAEVTTNFKRGGTITKSLDAYGTTFLNASMAGFYKQLRNITEQPNGTAFLKFTGKLMALGLTPAVINSLLYASPFGDDDEKKEAKEAYDSLKQYEKDDYLLWYKGDGKFIKIPKGRAVSIPAIVYNAAKNKVQGKETDLKETLNSILNQIGPNNPLSDNTILSLSQVKLFDPKSQGTSWSGSPIESSYMSENKRPGQRYDSKTDEFSKWLGKKLDISPKKINYLINQNTGIVGDMVLPFITQKPSGKSELSRATNFLTRRFTSDTVTNNNITEEFYNKLTEYKWDKNDDNPNVSTPMAEVKSKYMGSKSSDIASIRKDMEAVNSDKTLSKNEKYDKTREMQKEINAIAKDALVNVDKVKKVSNIEYKVGDKTYIEKNGEMTSVKDETVKKAEDLGLTVGQWSDISNYKSNARADVDENGKTISGTAKKKVTNYVYSRDDLTEQQKINVLESLYPKKKG
jgi:hypothetical protein